MQVGARWALCAAVGLLALPLCANAQSYADIGGEYTITNLEVPKGGNFGIGDGKLWFLRKGELIRVDPDEKLLVPIRIDEMDVRTWAVSGGSLWIFGKSQGGWNIRRIDAQSGKLVSTIELANNRDQDFLYAYGSLWVWTGWELASEKPVLRIDPETKRAIEVGQKFKGDVLASDGKIWMLGVEDGEVRCLDPESNKIVDTFSVGRRHDNGILKGRFKGGSYSYVMGDGVLWVVETQGQNGGKYILSGYDIKTHQAFVTMNMEDGRVAPVIWRGWVWLSSGRYGNSGNSILRIDPKSPDSVGRIFIPIASKATREAEFLPPILAATEDSLWAMSGRWFAKDKKLMVRRIQVK